MARMELPVLDKFCFVLNLKTGCLLMGAVSSIFTFTLAVVMITFAMDVSAAAEAAGGGGAGGAGGAGSAGGGGVAVPGVVHTIVVLLVLLLLLYFLAHLVFVFAVYKEKRSLIKKFCISWLVFLVLFVVGFLKTLFHMSAGHVVAHLLYLAENFYFIITIRSYLISIHEDSVL